MAPAESAAVSGKRHDGPHETPRLRLKRKSPMSGVVDGAWWPRSDDLSKELPDLLSVLSVRLGSVARVSYSLEEWAPAPTKMVTGGRTVRLDGYHRQPANTLGILDERGTRIVLLVVPVDTDPDLAHNIEMAAAATDDVSTVEALLLSGGPHPQ